MHGIHSNWYTDMTIDEKKEIIQNLHEDQLREQIIVPLLMKLGFIDPIIHHHANEKGKDIVCKEYDPVFKKIRYLSIIVKKGNITGSSSGTNSYFAALNQIKQSFNEPYKHIYENREVYIDQCILIASGEILPTALESIYGTLKSERLDKAIRETIDISKLIVLIDENFQEFWSEFFDEKASLINQRNVLLNNFSKLIKVLVRDPADQERALKLITIKDTGLEIIPLASANRYIANILHSKIQIDEIEEYFTDEIPNSQCDIKTNVFDTKRSVLRVLNEISEITWILRKILEEKNPLKILEHCEELSDNVGYDGICLKVGDITDQESLVYALKEYQDKKEILLKNNMLDFYRLINNDVRAKTKEALFGFLKRHSRDEQNAWLGYEVKFKVDQKKIISSSTYEYHEELVVIEETKWGASHKTEKLSSNNEEIKMEIAINKYGIFDRDKLSIEAQAEYLAKYFSRPISKKFIEIISQHSS